MKLKAYDFREGTGVYDHNHMLTDLDAGITHSLSQIKESLHATLKKSYH